jgi:hypothetical protein
MRTPPRISKLILVGVGLLAAAGCEPARHPGADPFQEEAGTVIVFYTVNCEGRSADGTCQKQRCQATRDSNCLEYAGYCLEYGHTWTGTKDEGHCTRRAE